MDILWKALAGGLMTALIAWAAKRGTVLPGILPLFPSLGLISLWLVGSRGDAAGFRQACVAGAKTIPAYLVYLAVCWFLAPRMPLGSSIRRPTQSISPAARRSTTRSWATLI